MAKPGPKKGHIEAREEAARKHGQAQIFGLANKVSKQESVVARIKRAVKGEGLFERK